MKFKKCVKNRYLIMFRVYIKGFYEIIMEKIVWILVLENEI